jgi:uncharacterized protein (TIGR03437 family)
LTWLSAATGTTTNTVSVSAALGSLPPGIYTGNVVLTVPGAPNSPLTVPVTFTVAPVVPLADLGSSAGSLLFTASAPGATPAPQTFSVVNTGGSAALGFTATASTNSGGAWLSITPSTGVSPQTITVTVNTAPGGTNLPQGGYNGTITIGPAPGSAASNTVTVPVGLAINAPAIEPGGVVGAAIFNASVSSGSIVSLFGVNLATSTASAPSTPLPTTLAGTTVTITGTTTTGAPFSGSAPLFYVSPTQINAQIPPNLTGTVTITVVSGTTTGVSTTVTLNAVSPGIFVASGTQGAILNQDYSANTSTNPAAAGSFILIYATGLGPTSPALAAGAPGATSAPFNLTVDPVTVSINGQNATVAFSGAAPGFVGLFQLNAQIPAGTPAGNTVPVQLTVQPPSGSAVSSNIVTICVKTSAPEGQ